MNNKTSELDQIFSNIKKNYLNNDDTFKKTKKNYIINLE
jgi:hypothetical protein